jgi:hypothetical protein
MVKMVVGRTLWDFVFEALQTPGLRVNLVALLILLELLLIVLLLLIHSGLIGVKISVGGLGIELNHLGSPLS